VAAYVKRLRPEIRVIGVEAMDADAMTRSLAAGQRVRLKQGGLFADGAAARFEPALSLVQRFVY
jgi:threonine dehydratase